MVEPITCHRCGEQAAPDRLDVEGWIVLDAREDGWVLLVCPECQSVAERGRVDALQRRADAPSRARAVVTSRRSLGGKAPWNQGSGGSGWGSSSGSGW